MTVKKMCGSRRLRSIRVLTLVSLLVFSLVIKATQANADNVTLNLEIAEVLSVTLSPVSVYAYGNTGDFLRNQVDLRAECNNYDGCIAYMTTKTNDTALSHASTPATIPTLSSRWWRGSSVTNFWGYSLSDYSSSGSYFPMVGANSTPIEIDNSDTNLDGTIEATVWFGAKIDSTKDAGAYHNTVVFTVVSGTVNVPSGNTPQSNDPGDELASSGSDNEPAISGRDSNIGLIDKTDSGSLGDGDGTRGVTYTPPQGVSSSSDIHDGDPVTTGLIATASVAAGAGVLFLILAKRDDDDEDEEGAEAA